MVVGLEEVILCSLFWSIVLLLISTWNDSDIYSQVRETHNQIKKLCISTQHQTSACWCLLILTFFRSLASYRAHSINIGSDVDSSLQSGQRLYNSYVSTYSHTRLNSTTLTCTFKPCCFCGTEVGVLVSRGSLLGNGHKPNSLV